MIRSGARRGRLLDVLLPARSREDHPAIVDDHGSLTFGELRQRVHDAMVSFESHGLTAGDRVMITMTRRIEAVVAMMATMAMDGTYVPVDPRWPIARLELLRDAAGTSFEIRDDGVLRRLDPLPGGGLTPGVAYIIFTSGSTGTPKGVAVAGPALENLLANTAEWYPLPASARSAALHAFSFDFSVWELFAPLARGATVVLLDDVARSDPVTLARKCERFRITTLSLTATEARHLLAAMDGGWPASVDRVILGGEATTLGLCQTLHRLDLDVWNFYGPTEATVWCSFHRFAPTDRQVLIGRPLPNLTISVLDDDLAAARPDAQGEIYIGGRGTAIGYLSSPALTAQAFVPDPFAAIPGSRMYRSGDAGLVRPSGDAVCLGRIDDQVKVRGFRVDLSEIETALEAFHGVDAAAVTVEDGVATRGFVVCDVSVSQIALRRHLSALLPGYLLPRRLDRIASLPTNSNGKLDRPRLERLPTLDFADDEAMAGPTVAGTHRLLITRAWSQALRIVSPMPSDDFFDLGGDSLAATQLVGQIRAATGRNLTVRDVVEARTLGGICDRVDELPPDARDSQLIDAAATGQATRAFGATAMQSFFLTLQRTLPEGALNVALGWHVDGILDPKLLRAALERVQREHQLLDSACSRRGRSWTFGPADGHRSIDLEVIATDDEQLPDLLRRSARAPIGPTGVLWRATLVQGPTRSALVVVGHHALFDRVSTAILRRSLVRAYRAVAVGATEAPVEPLIDFGHYADWQSRYQPASAQQDSLAFWESMLADSSPVEWPGRTVDEAMPATVTHNLAIELPSAFDSSIRAACAATATTPFIVALTSLARVIGDASGGKKATIATQMANRMLAGVDNIVGNFTTSVLLNVPARAGSFAAQLALCRATVLGALDHQRVSMDTVLSLPSLRHLRSAPGGALLQHFVVDDPIDEFDGVEATFLDLDDLVEAQPMEFQIILENRAETWSVRTLARARLFRRQVAEAALADFATMLLRVVEELRRSAGKSG